MPGSGPHRWYFVGEVPLLFRVLIILLFVNTVLSLGLPSVVQHLLPKSFDNLPICADLSGKTAQVHAPAFVCEYLGGSIPIQFIILALMALTMLFYRKQVRYEYRGRR
jgi:hypothetical protein